ncbi:hypothetical protein IH601_00380 [Candidatus Bipolaricaulota bacterium]|nr:hypothetical protein [Candidatus Bipolaricaulota bacterium]TFH08481.1 MAG: hypothetical protein E4H08_07690 [Candidatus Atribacteria bacterium]
MTRHRKGSHIVSGSSIIIVGLAVAGIAIAMWFSAKRKKEIAAWAAKAGLSFSAGSDRSYDNRYPHFGCLHRGHTRSATNIASGTWKGRWLEAFDYRYVTGHGKNRSVHTFSAIILRSDFPLKSLQLRPENAFDKLTEFFGADDIDFESDEFSREFHVKSPDKKWAFDVLHQRTMQFLLKSPRYSIEFDTGSVICWRNRRLDISARESAIEVALGILDQLPEYVIREQSKGAT